MPFNMPNIYVNLSITWLNQDDSKLKALGTSGDIDNDSNSDESTDDNSEQIK